MILKEVKVKEKSIENDRLLFETVCFKNNITILFGGNGVGKSTFIQGIINRTLEFDIEDDVEIISFVNSQDNLNRARRMAKNLPDFAGLISCNSYSEGQSMVYWLLRFYHDCIEEPLKEGKKILVCVDEMDSGLSVENINFLLHLIVDTAKQYKDDVQFIISTNHYHYAYVFKEVLNMYDGKYIKINSYEEYFDLLNKGIKYMIEKGRDFSFIV